MTSEIERADTVDRRRAQVAPFLGVLVLSANQWLFFGASSDALSMTRMILWLVLMLVVLGIVLTGGDWLLPKAVRRLTDDEATRASAGKALKGGFAAAMITALIVFVVAPFEPISAQRAAHLIISLGLGLALVVFGFEERRNLD